jgi:nitrite reductase/ring-hydroxylating ferredoxin subunit
VLTAEENELLTRTGPGTPGGELLRRYWQPVALSEELPPGGAPLALRVMDEELVLFRDERGRPGLLGLHCAHRGADLSYGRLEDGGIRCIYHGWLYDADGRCLAGPASRPDMFAQVFLEFFRDGRVSRKTADWAGVSKVRPEIPSLVEQPVAP